MPNRLLNSRVDAAADHVGSLAVARNRSGDTRRRGSTCSSMRVFRRRRRRPSRRRRSPANARRPVAVDEEAIEREAAAKPPVSIASESPTSSRPAAVAFDAEHERVPLPVDADAGRRRPAVDRRERVVERRRRRIPSRHARRCRSRTSCRRSASATASAAGGGLVDRHVGRDARRRHEREQRMRKQQDAALGGLLSTDRCDYRRIPMSTTVAIRQRCRSELARSVTRCAASTISLEYAAAAWLIMAISGQRRCLRRRARFTADRGRGDCRARLFCCNSRQLIGARLDMREFATYVAAQLKPPAAMLHSAPGRNIFMSFDTLGLSDKVVSAVQGGRLHHPHPHPGSRRFRTCWRAATCSASPRPAPARRRPSCCRC